MAAHSSIGNLLLDGLAAGSFARIKPLLDPVPLPAGLVLDRQGETIDWVYFPDDGMLSVMVDDPEKRLVEVGIIGREGMSGVPLLLGDSVAAHKINVQIAGSGRRIAADDLVDAMQSDRPMQDYFLLYARALELQTAATVASQADGTIEERLARWLLMCHDRVIGDRIDLTHEFMAIMLTVRRPGVTVALQILEGQHLIRSLRGHVVILDRDGLEAAANGRYGGPEAAYQRLFGLDPAMPEALTASAAQ